jgi:hypothetical protein
VLLDLADFGSEDSNSQNKNESKSSDQDLKPRKKRL